MLKREKALLLDANAMLLEVEGLLLHVEAVLLQTEAMPLQLGTKNSATITCGGVLPIFRWH